MTLPLIAIFGGSFNPIHLGHLSMAKIVAEEIPNTYIYFVPCGKPVHRAAANIAEEDRLTMINLAIQPYTHYHLSRFEIDSPEPSYTINTLLYFRQQYPNNPLAFIMGMDTFTNLDISWGKNWQELLDYTHLLVLPRVGYSNKLSDKLASFLGEKQKQKDFLHKFLCGGIILLNDHPLDMSSTEIRKKLMAHEDVSALLPEGLYDYIQQKRLYHD